jgi:hypothetical protein
MEERADASMEDAAFGLPSESKRASDPSTRELASSVFPVAAHAGDPASPQSVVHVLPANTQLQLIEGAIMPLEGVPNPFAPPVSVSPSAREPAPPAVLRNPPDPSPSLFDRCTHCAALGCALRVEGCSLKCASHDTRPAVATDPAGEAAPPAAVRSWELMCHPALCLFSCAKGIAWLSRFGHRRRKLTQWWFAPAPILLLLCGVLSFAWMVVDIWHLAGVQLPLIIDARSTRNEAEEMAAAYRGRNRSGKFDWSEDNSAKMAAQRMRQASHFAVRAAMYARYDMPSWRMSTFGPGSSLIANDGLFIFLLAMAVSMVWHELGHAWCAGAMHVPTVKVGMACFYWLCIPACFVELRGMIPITTPRNIPAAVRVPSLAERRADRRRRAHATAVKRALKSGKKQQRASNKSTWSNFISGNKYSPLPSEQSAATEQEGMEIVTQEMEMMQLGGDVEPLRGRQPSKASKRGRKAATLEEGNSLLYVQPQSSALEEEKEEKTEQDAEARSNRRIHELESLSPFDRALDIGEGEALPLPGEAVPLSDSESPETTAPVQPDETKEDGGQATTSSKARAGIVKGEDIPVTGVEVGPHHKYSISASTAQAKANGLAIHLAVSIPLPPSDAEDGSALDGRNTSDAVCASSSKPDVTSSSSSSSGGAAVAAAEDDWAVFPTLIQPPVQGSVVSILEPNHPPVTIPAPVNVERNFADLKLHSRLQILGAGIWHNLVLCAVVRFALLLLPSLLEVHYTRIPAGVLVLGVDRSASYRTLESAPASLRPGLVLTHFDDVPLSDEHSFRDIAWRLYSDAMEEEVHGPRGGFCFPMQPTLEKLNTADERCCSSRVFEAPNVCIAPGYFDLHSTCVDIQQFLESWSGARCVVGHVVDNPGPNCVARTWSPDTYTPLREEQGICLPDLYSWTNAYSYNQRLVLLRARPANDACVDPASQALLTGVACTHTLVFVSEAYDLRDGITLDEDGLQWWPRNAGDTMPSEWSLRWPFYATLTLWSILSVSLSMAIINGIPFIFTDGGKAMIEILETRRLKRERTTHMQGASSCDDCTGLTCVLVSLLLLIGNIGLGVTVIGMRAVLPDSWISLTPA